MHKTLKVVNKFSYFFNTKYKNLQKKLDKLTNDKNSNSKDRQVRRILEQAGKDIDNLL